MRCRGDGEKNGRSRPPEGARPWRPATEERPDRGVVGAPGCGARPLRGYMRGMIQNIRSGKHTMTASRGFTTEATVPERPASQPKVVWQKLIT